MADEDGSAGSSGDLRMFAIFIFSLLLLCLIPVTLWRISTGASSEVAVAQPWEKVCTRSTVLLCAYSTHANIQASD